MKRIGRVVVAVLLLLPAVAAAQDLKTIAGQWAGDGGNSGTTRAGEARGYSNAGPLELTVAEDGSGEWFFPRNRVKVKVTFTVSDGKIVWETITSTGVARLEEKGGKRILTGEGKRKDGSAESWFQLTAKK